jgi:hypothetical protein
LENEMGEDVNMRRSQAILRLPVDSVLATLMLHDGERSDVLLFLSPGEGITDLITPGDPFVPMIRDARFCLVARDAIAAIGIVTGPVRPDDDALPIKRQRARVRLRSGKVIEGELRWTVCVGDGQTADHVNEPAAFLVVHATAPETTYYIAKSQVAIVEEA